jgi:CheY-like chemotaxis protein
MRGHLYDLTDVDDAFLAIVGYTREDFERGLSWRELTPPEYLHLDEAGMRQAAVVGATVVAHEITARLRAEERVRASEALFRSLAESLPVGVCLVDDEGAVTYTNRAFAGLGTDDGSSPELRDALRAAAAELRGNEQVVVLTMPGMSGRELLRRTRALRPSVRGVLMSGNAELGGHTAEPDPFVVLEKPFLTSELLDRVLAS